MLQHHLSVSEMSKQELQQRFEKEQNAHRILKASFNNQAANWLHDKREMRMAEEIDRQEQVREWWLSPLDSSSRGGSKGHEEGWWEQLGVSRWIAISDKFHPETLVMAEPELRLVEKVRERDAVSSQMYCLHTGYHCVAIGQQRENVPIPSEEKHWSTTPDASRLISWINLLQLTVFLHKLIRKVSKYLSVMVHDCIWGLRFLYISHM